jgi:hypothetical protein
MRLSFLLVLAVCLSSPVAAHDAAFEVSGPAHSRKLAFLLPNLFGSDGLVLPNPSHLAHFDSAFRDSFGPFNSSLASQLTSLPIPSPASGFTYSFDSSLGTSIRSAQSFGPILAERAETIGKNKIYFGFAFQSFRFDSIDGVDLNRVPVVFKHAPAANPLFAQDVVSTDNFLDLRIGQFTSYFSYGLTDRLDVSVAAPIVTASLLANSKATIRRIGTGTDDTVHFFPSADKTTSQFSAAATASGLGDVVVRVKGTVYRGRAAGIALGMDLRAPTGDEYNFLGSGATGF